jgi:D-alanyl-lipoteichoic acid acyltransferase DltB (MBOAT superfamily)
MLFNSLEFAIFLPIVFFLYWFMAKKSLRVQNMLLLLASYFFYGCWDWRFLFLLAISTFIDYFTGLRIHAATSQNSKRLWLRISIIANLGFLGVFKYYNFFAESLESLLSSAGIHVNPGTLEIILPVGISFYTFHGLSYVFDIYKGKITPTGNWVNYSLFVSFFPLLVAGPIERATHLLPQVEKPRQFDYTQAVRGMRLILWGLFKKIVIADALAIRVDGVFSNIPEQSALSLIIGTVFFAIQIYCDFSGYTDIARGVARLFGFELLLNFAFPYFSRDIAEFWRRWHISLSSWFRDYLYIPLGGSRKGTDKAITNTFIIFLVSGLWHGANWTFIIWGLLHAIYFMPLLLLRRNRYNTGPISPNSIVPSLKVALQICFTFCLTCFAWIFFRAPDLGTAFTFIAGLFTHPFYNGDEVKQLISYLPVMIGFLFTAEWISRNDSIEHLFDRFKTPIVRYLFYIIIALLIILFGTFNDTAFIYFQF